MLNCVLGVTVKLKAVAGDGTALGGDHEMRRGGYGGTDVDSSARTGDAALPVSVAVMVWLPAVFSVALKVPAPAGQRAGSRAACRAAALVKWTVPV